jgi:hypothetical protein
MKCDPEQNLTIGSNRSARLRTKNPMNNIPLLREALGCLETAPDILSDDAYSGIMA